MDILASDDTKTTLENNVSWYLADKLSDATVTIATKKYLTPDNLLVYLTRCIAAETTIPRIKVQVLKRVSGGIMETNYQLYGDHSLVKTLNPMIFGQVDAAVTSAETTPVTEAEASELVELVNSLQTARQTL